MTSSRNNMLDALFDRVLILNRAGRVVYTNEPARSDYDGAVCGLLLHPELRAALDALRQSGSDKPVRLKLPTAADPDTLVPVTVCPAPNGTDMAVIVHATVPAGDRATADGRTIAELMRQHLLEPLTALVRDLKPKLAGGEAPTAQTLERAQQLHDRLEKLADMIAVFGGEAMIADERILTGELIEEVCRDAVAEPMRGRVRIALTGVDDKLPSIYGSRRWLLRGLREIVENALMQGLRESARAAVPLIEVHARAAGEFLLLRVHNHGAFSGGVADGARFVPFASGRDPAKLGARAVSRIGLPLAQRIVELHGGNLRVKSRDGDDSTEVIVQLPTGAPHTNKPQLDAEQVKRYAEDLSKLMARRARARPSPAAAGQTPGS